MQEHISGAIIANRVLMMRTQHKGAFLLAEGSWDARLFKRFVDSPQCEVTDAVNKENAIDAIKILEQHNFTGALAVVDADFSRLENSQFISNNLLLTDTHDIETMIIRSPALEKVLLEYGSEEKLSKLSKDARTMLIEGGAPIGYLRWISSRGNLSLKFEGLTFSRFVNKDTLDVDVPALVKTVCDHSCRPDLKVDELQAQILNLKSDAHDLWQVCCGHDLICLISIGLCKKLGSRNPQEVQPKHINRALRLAYETPHFCATQLYSSIRKWEEDNKPFQVLGMT